MPVCVRPSPAEAQHHLHPVNAVGREEARFSPLLSVLSCWGWIKFAKLIHRKKYADFSGENKTFENNLDVMKKDVKEEIFGCTSWTCRGHPMVLWHRLGTTVLPDKGSLFDFKLTIVDYCIWSLSVPIWSSSSQWVWCQSVIMVTALERLRGIQWFYDTSWEPLCYQIRVSIWLQVDNSRQNGLKVVVFI